MGMRNENGNGLWGRASILASVTGRLPVSPKAVHLE